MKNQRHFLLIFIKLTIIGIVGCSSPNSSTNNEIASKSELPSDRSYDIINKELDDAFSKSTINVRLNKVVSKEILKKIAYEIKSDNSKYSKLWIYYFLPEMNTGSGAWAISHFKPALELEIIGASKAATDEMKNQKVTGEILATWIDNDAIAPNTKYLVKENGKLLIKSVYAQTKYVDATELVEELTKTTYQRQIRYNYQNNHGEYYLVEQNGNLSLYDSEGKFKELKKQ